MKRVHWLLLFGPLLTAIAAYHLANLALALYFDGIKWACGVGMVAPMIAVTAYGIGQRWAGVARRSLFATGLACLSLAIFGGSLACIPIPAPRGYFHAETAVMMGCVVMIVEAFSAYVAFRAAMLIPVVGAPDSPRRAG